MTHCKEIQPVHPIEIIPEYSLEGLMLKLKLQYLGHLMWRTVSWKRPWCWDRLKAGERDDRGWDGRMVSLTQWTWVWVNSGSWWWTGRPGMLQSMGSQRVGHDWATELNWWLSIVTHPAYLTSMQSRSCNILGWMKHKLESRLLWKITSDIQMIPF